MRKVMILICAALVVVSTINLMVVAETGGEFLASLGMLCLSCFLLCEAQEDG